MATCKTDVARNSKMACVLGLIETLEERDEQLNSAKLERVPFPASNASPGEPNQIATNGLNLAIYDEEHGWLFTTLSKTIVE